jgi:Uma2 family endonuclease
MTSAAPRHHAYAYADYLALERDSNVRHEYIDGEIYAMAGGTPEHALLCADVITDLRTRLRGGPPVPRSEPEHTATLSGFYLDRYEITLAPLDVPAPRS